MIVVEVKVDFLDVVGFCRLIKFNCILCSRFVEFFFRGFFWVNLLVFRGVWIKRFKGLYLFYEMD